MDIVLSTLLYLTVVSSDIEDDGSFNYLLERKNGSVELQYSIAYSHLHDMGLKLGDSFYAEVKANCSLVWALDPTPKVLEETFPWGIPRRSYICSATSLIIDNIEYTSIIRSKHG